EASEGEVERFERAVDAQAVLANVPGIVHALSRGRTMSGSPFFTMELVRGGSLRTLVESGQTDPRTLVLLLASVAWAVHEAHDRGVVHRDLKLENILIDFSEDGEIWPVIVDFGLAHDVYDHEEATSSAGTPAYMAPEQIKG